jgi:Flp pilus assembly protein TadD
MLERAAELNSEEPAIYYQLARAYQASGRSADARRAFEKVRRMRGAEKTNVEPPIPAVR